MSDTGAFPPPGSTPWSPPGTPPPPPPPPPAPAWQAPVAYAAHKPGAIPLRPLALGDLYNGAFKIIRVNPAATVGSAALVSTVAMAIPLLLGGALVATFDVGTWFGSDLDETEVLAEAGSLATTLLGSLIQSFGLIFVTGMVAQVVMAATVGQKLSLGGAWAATLGVRWRLVGLSLLLTAAYLLVSAAYVLLWFLVIVADEIALAVVWGVVTVPLFVCLLVWLYIRVYYFAAAVLVVERKGVLLSIRRGHYLTSKQFWRTFGIALLTTLITGLAASVLSLPVTFLAVAMPFLVEGTVGMFLMLVLQSVGTVLASAFVAPFTSAVVTLQYVDQRIRKEAYDVELLTRAGLPAT
ncbi:hypothetical protein [Nocardia salmonicida]|uniref:hypothetical protein n=1 Tax=Nocardia salmonicida TaxID=53431 RepID=UPI0033C94580